MSKTKGGGSTRNGRDSNAQRLGVKSFDGTLVTTGSIIIRNAEHSSTQDAMLEWARITHCLPLLQET